MSSFVSKVKSKYLLQVLSYLVKGEEIKLDLSKVSNAMQWAKKNIADIGEEVEDNEGEVTLQLTEQDEDRIDAYCGKYAEIIKKPKIIIYRAVALNNIKQLKLNDIGMHWSFEKEGAGVYGADSSKYKNVFVLTGEVNPKGINWEYGLTSFVYYGEDQWECALEIDTPVTIIAVDDEKLEKPLKAKVGKT